MLSSDKNELFETVAKVEAKGGLLRSLFIERIGEAIAAALQNMLGDLSGEIRGKLSQSTGLSELMVDWSLRTSIPQGGREFFVHMEKALMQSPLPGSVPVPSRLSVVWLSGNVFTASLRALLVPLLLRVPVIAKVSSRDELFPRFLKRHLNRVDAEVGAALEIVSLPRDNHDFEDALLSQADVVSVYGNDATIRELRGRVPATTQFIAHGHGLGAIYVGRGAFDSASKIEKAAKDIALDVAAYDQRGCLSPHAVWVDCAAGLSCAPILLQHGRSVRRSALRLPRL